MSHRTVVFCSALALLASSGCAMIGRSDAMDTERLLAASGFRMQLADTSARMAHVEALPQRKLTPVPHGSENRFVYADATYCKCMYVGTEEAFDRFQKLSTRQEIAEEQEAASLDWGAWGPWY